MWNVLGFEKQKAYFQEIIARGTLAHAYLFSGPDMIGKRTFALDLYRIANHLVDLYAADADLCLLAPRAAEGELKIYIDDIRTLKNFLAFKPAHGPIRMVLIDDAHQLTVEASNALLKVLEEPLSGVVFILISGHVEQLLPTIRSRCQEVRFLPHKREVVETYTRDKKLGNDDGDFATLLAQGRIGWLMRTLDAGKLEETKRAIEELRRIARQGIFERLQYAQKIYEKGAYSEMANHWLRWVYGNMAHSKRSSEIMRHLVRLNSLLAQPQYNHRLALERFLLAL